MLGSHLLRLRTAFDGSLRLRVMMLILGLFSGIALVASVSFLWIVDSTTEKLGTLYAGKQVLYDRHRGLEALMREIGLAETLARSPAVLAWAADEKDPGLRQRALAELEHYRLAFRDKSYFLVVDASGDYYFNDRANQYAGNQLRYTLRKDNPRDGWYYKTAQLGAGCHLNVDNDDALGVTKVWMNCVMREAGRTLGILGTGIDLTTFIRDVVNTDQAGVQSLFVDRRGAVQAIRDEDKIDFHSLTKGADTSKTVFQLIDDADQPKLADMLRGVSDGTRNVDAQFLHVDGKRLLVGAGYLGKLGWYNIVFMDVDAIVDRRLFLPIAGLLVFIVVSAAILVTLLFKRGILDRIEAAERTVARVEAGDFSAGPVDRRNDEIGRLGLALSRMASAVHDNTSLLEQAVQDRTEELRRLSEHDPMTGILNRRGFTEAVAAAEAAALRDGRQIGLLLLDVDRFKTINDNRGHAVGDAVIREVAARIGATVRPGDLCARWGGDEFIVLVADCSPDVLDQIAVRILQALRTVPVEAAAGVRLRITASIGGHVFHPQDGLTLAVHNTDLALYAAKRAGRNRLVIFDAVLHHDVKGSTRVA
ncbi:MAG: diguanylate cyclase [Rhizobiaceae bacterium]|nr:diguanylate cyclase [Rhizobiaceae bacterium]